MTEKIMVDCDYGLLAGCSYTAWKNIANYKVTKIESFDGYTKFRINFVPFGELGTFEVKKDIRGCMVVFSDMSIFDNNDAWLEDNIEEIRQTANANDDIALLLGQRFSLEMEKINPEMHKAKQETWKETIESYKKMVAGIEKSGAAKPEKPIREKLLQQACTEWANRKSAGHLGRYTRQEFLDDFQERTGKVITKDEFRRALERAQASDVIGKLRSKTRP